MVLEKEHLFKEGEVILEKVRKHWIVYVGDFLLHFFGCIIFISLALYLTRDGGLLSDKLGAYSAEILIAFVILFWVSFFYSWTKSYFDVWYITYKHIVAVNQKEMFDREESFMELNRIQDVFFEREGLLSTIFNFGTLRIQSAGTEQEFVIERIRRVEEVAHSILELRDRAKKKVSNENSVDNIYNL